MRHLFFPSHRLTEYTGQHGVTRYDEVMFPSDDAAAVSDLPAGTRNSEFDLRTSPLRPIWIRVRVPATDDD